MTNQEGIHFVEFRKSDAGFLFELLLQRSSKENISHKKMPTYEEHIKFIISKPYYKWYIVKKDENLIELLDEEVLKFLTFFPVGEKSESSKTISLGFNNLIVVFSENGFGKSNKFVLKCSEIPDTIFVTVKIVEVSIHPFISVTTRV